MCGHTRPYETKCVRDPADQKVHAIPSRYAWCHIYAKTCKQESSLREPLGDLFAAAHISSTRCVHAQHCGQKGRSKSLAYCQIKIMLFSKSAQHWNDMINLASVTDWHLLLNSTYCIGRHNFAVSLDVSMNTTLNRMH